MKHLLIIGALASVVAGGSAQAQDVCATAAGRAATVVLAEVARRNDMTVEMVELGLTLNGSSRAGETQKLEDTFRAAGADVCTLMLVAPDSTLLQMGLPD